MQDELESDSLGDTGIRARDIMGEDGYLYEFKLPMIVQMLHESPQAMAVDDTVRQDLRKLYHDPRAYLILEQAMRGMRMHPPDCWRAIFAPDVVPRRRITRSENAATPDAPEDQEEGEDAPWRRHILCDSYGRPRDVHGNYMEILEKHPYWRGKFTFDTLYSTARVEGELVTDIIVSEISRWLMVELQMPVNRLSILRKAIDAVASATPVDPLRDWIEQLPPWDGTPRFDHFLIDYAGASDTSYSRWVSMQILCGMIARALTPGCIMRTVAIMEGPENIGKSRLVEALGAPWSSQLFAGLEAKEAQMRLKGIWVMELPELNALSKAEETRIKAFISATNDTYVPKYSNDAVSYPRRTVFIGTTNESWYLKGQTGNTRFLPIMTPLIDLAGFMRVREQLLSEALIVVRSGATWWEEPEWLKHEVYAERRAREVVNEYEAPLAEWLDDLAVVSVTWPQIARDFLKIETPERWKDVALQKQIAAAMRAIGWERKKMGSGLNTQRIWARITEYGK